MAYALRDFYNNKYPIGNKLQIGRDQSNQIILNDPQASSFHATLWEQNGILYLQDGTGGTATFVNQAPIQGTVALRLGDQIVTGSTPFTVDELNSPPSPGVPMAAPPSASIPGPNSAPTLKKRAGCGRWMLIALIVFASECVLIAALGAILASTDIELKGGLQDLKTAFSSSGSSESAPSDINFPGPTILNLKDTWLTSYQITSFTQHIENLVEGVSPENQPSSASFIADKIQQSTPEWIKYTLSQQLTNGVVVDQIEKGLVKNNFYTVTLDSPDCLVESDTDAGFHNLDQAPADLLTKQFTGHVKLVEEGVTVNGVIADRYELRKDNFIKVDTVIEMISGNLYRARDGGYLVKLDYVVMLKPQTWAINIGEDFSETEPVQVTYHFDRTIMPEGSQTYKVPEACADQVQ